MSANLRYWTGQTCASTHLTRQIPSDFLIVDILPHLSIVFRLALYVTKPGGPLLPIDNSSNIFTYIYIYNAANCCILRLHLRWIWPQSWKSSNLVYGRAESWKHAELRNCQKQSKSLFAPLLYIVEWFWAQKSKLHWMFEITSTNRKRLSMLHFYTFTSKSKRFRSYKYGKILICRSEQR